MQHCASMASKEAGRTAQRAVLRSRAPLVMPPGLPGRDVPPYRDCEFHNLTPITIVYTVYVPSNIGALCV